MYSRLQSLLHRIKQKILIINCRNTYRKIVLKCVVCSNTNLINADQIRANSSTDPVTTYYPINMSGVEFCDPLSIKGKGNVYIIRFIFVY